MPPRRVLGAGKASAGEGTVCLWDRPGRHEPQSPTEEERVFQVTTAVGPRWIWGSNAKLHSVPAANVWALSPLLRELVTLPHIVGVAEIAGDLVWLVDPTRFSPLPAEVNTAAEVAV